MSISNTSDDAEGARRAEGCPGADSRKHAAEGAAVQGQRATGSNLRDQVTGRGMRSLDAYPSVRGRVEHRTTDRGRRGERGGADGHADERRESKEGAAHTARIGRAV